MVFDYYYRLSKKDQAIYRRSDKIERVEFTSDRNYLLLLEELKNGLRDENKPCVQKLSRKIVSCLVQDLGTPTVKTKVLAARPSSDWGELHGLYEPEEDGEKPCITVWMRTAKHKKVVAFNSYLRTILHEFCHHLDYEHYNLDESYHTEGFFKRESNLYKQLTRK